MFTLKINMERELVTAKEETSVVAKATIRQKEAIQNLLNSKGLEVDVDFKTINIKEAAELIQQLIAASTPKQRQAVLSYVDKGVPFDGDILSFQECGDFLRKAPVVYAEYKTNKASEKKLNYALSLLQGSSNITLEDLKLLSDEELNSLITLEKEKKKEHFESLKFNSDLKQFKRDQILFHERDMVSTIYPNESSECSFRRIMSEEFGSDNTEEIIDIIKLAEDNARKIGEDVTDYITYKLKGKFTQDDIKFILSVGQEFGLI